MTNAPPTRRCGALILMAIAIATLASDPAASDPAASGPATARRKHHRLKSTERPAPPGTPPIPHAYSYYPEEIEGGVSGNLPFNNQIRKFRDPLNANGR